ncbi:MAG: hypothetical protein R2862_08435 [Thermoanaerobaculia bacterium]
MEIIAAVELILEDADHVRSCDEPVRLIPADDPITERKKKPSRAVVHSSVAEKEKTAITTSG